VAVARFLEGKIGFTEIPHLIEAVLTRSGEAPVHTLEDVLDADRAARECAEQCLALRNPDPRGVNGAAHPVLSS
jgi:1-deoxy-D-xylulose-5-phosphate reductoisomerase